MVESEFIAELEAALQAQENPADAFTTREWCAMLGLGHEAVRKRLRKLQDMDRLETVQKLTRVLGGTKSVNAYRILPG